MVCAAMSLLLMTTPRLPNTASDPPRGSGLAWGGPGRRPVKDGLTLDVSCHDVSSAERNGPQRPCRPRMRDARRPNIPQKFNRPMHRYGVGRRRLRPYRWPDTRDSIEGRDEEPSKLTWHKHGVLRVAKPP